MEISVLAFADPFQAGPEPIARGDDLGGQSAHVVWDLAAMEIGIFRLIPDELASQQSDLGTGGDIGGVGRNNHFRVRLVAPV
jgi:hypothetical protein